jgi:probable HAF family extracellular repeat protein
MIELELLPGGNDASAMGVNDDGVVVGSSDSSVGVRRAVVWRDGRIVDLGLGDDVDSSASAVNRHGVIVGSTELLGNRLGEARAFIWRNGRITHLSNLGGHVAWAVAVNDHDWVVGSSTTKNGQPHAFVWRSGVMTDLGAFPGRYQSSQAYDVDNDGRIVGRATVDGMNTVPVMWDESGIKRLTDRLGRATGINSQGQVTGGLATGAESFIWSRGQLTVIGPVEDEMYVQTHGIDRDGRVVGTTGVSSLAAAPSPLPMAKPHDRSCGT